MHCATDTFGHHGKRNKGAEDPYIQMIGGEFVTHGAQQEVRIDIVDPDFPGLAKGFGNQAVRSTSRMNGTPQEHPEDLHVILVQVTEGMKGKMYDRPNYPITWARSTARAASSTPQWVTARTFGPTPITRACLWARRLGDRSHRRQYRAECLEGDAWVQGTSQVTSCRVTLQAAPIETDLAPVHLISGPKTTLPSMIVPMTFEANSSLGLTSKRSRSTTVRSARNPGLRNPETLFGECRVSRSGREAAKGFLKRETRTRSVVGKRVLQRALGRCRAAGHADHVNEGAQRGRNLPVPGVIEVHSFERWRPVFQHAGQLAGRRNGSARDRVVYAMPSPSTAARTANRYR